MSQSLCVAPAGEVPPALQARRSSNGCTTQGGRSVATLPAHMAMVAGQTHGHGQGTIITHPTS